MTSSADSTQIRPLTASDITASFHDAWADFKAAPVSAMFFASFFVISGLMISNVTWITGTTYWLVIAALGFPLIGALAAVGFYEISRIRARGERPHVAAAWSEAWDRRKGQLPWLATIIIMIFLFWFFLGHMIFALFLGLAPMQNIFSSFDVLLTANGLQMLAFGTLVGAVFSVLVFGISVMGLPMLVDQDVDFVTALVRSLSAVFSQPVFYLTWGAIIGVVTLISMVPFFLGLFVTMPIFGFMTWHIYKRATGQTP